MLLPLDEQLNDCEVVSKPLTDELHASNNPQSWTDDFAREQAAK